MFRKIYLSLSLTALLFFAAAAGAFAQTNAPIRGVVTLEKDGTKTPVAGAVVEAFRADVDKGKGLETKTNKRGEFGYVGFPLGMKYVIAVSGPGIAPTFMTDIKSGTENVEVIVSEGDGRRLTEAEVRTGAKSSAGAPTGEMSEAERKQRAELEKKNAEITASNRRAEDTNKIVNAALKAGAAAFEAKNYDAAIAEFDKGVEADPEFAGSAPVLLNYKGVALQKRAVATYAAASQGDATARVAALEKIKPDLTNALATFERGLEILKKAPAGGDAAEQANTAKNKQSLLSNRLETYGLLARLAPDPAKAELADAALNEYIASETDATKRTPVILAYGNNMNGAGETKNAAAAFRKVLEVAPDNIDALIGLGLALYTEGYSANPPDKAMLQEGLNYMQRFVDTAPDTHKLKQSTRETIDNLKAEQNLKAQPTKAAPKKKG